MNIYNLTGSCLTFISDQNTWIDSFQESIGTVGTRTSSIGIWTQYELQTWRLKMEILQQEAPCTMEFARSSVWGWIKIKQQVVHHVEELHHEDPEKSQFP